MAFGGVELDWLPAALSGAHPFHPPIATFNGVVACDLFHVGTTDHIDELTHRDALGLFPRIVFFDNLLYCSSKAISSK